MLAREKPAKGAETARGFFRRHYAPLVVAAPETALIVLLALNISPGGRPAYFGPTYRFVVERGWLKMSDGVRLSVTYFKPIPGKSNEKFPVVFEELPYRKDDSSYQRDYPVCSQMARRGIAAARVDVCGTGSSQGASRTGSIRTPS